MPRQIYASWDSGARGVPQFYLDSQVACSRRSRLLQIESVALICFLVRGEIAPPTPVHLTRRACCCDGASSARGFARDDKWKSNYNGIKSSDETQFGMKRLQLRF